MKSGIRFSTFLTASFIAQATGSVLLISLCFFLYFDRRITSEFQDKLRAQRGQTELILEKRMEQVQRRLRDLSLDNTIRVTMMLGVTPQLEERIHNLYPQENGIYFFIRGGTEPGWLPAAYPGLSQELVRECLARDSAANLGRQTGTNRLFWFFSTPVMRRTELLGAAFALYDPAEDQYLLQNLRQTMSEGSDLAIRLPAGLLSVKTGTLLSLAPDAEQSSLNAFSAGADHILVPLEGFPDLFFFASLEKLQQEKRTLFLLIGLFSLLVTALSAGVGILLGRQMSRPLRELAAKAEEISEAREESLFASSSLYPEFNQLSQAFNTMISSLAEERKRYSSVLEEQLRDQEEKNKLKLQLQRGLRLEALGTLAGGIAHDFNNILMAVMAYTDLSLLQKPQPPEVMKFLERIRKAGIRGRDLVAQILAFSRQGDTNRSPVDIVPIVKETLKMLTPSLPEQIRLRWDLAAEGGTIVADPTQIHQVLMNLCLNARDAMRDTGGVLEVRLEKVLVDAEEGRRFSSLATGPYLRLEVSDTGTGMPAEVMEHIFEPFYTTKKPNEGTGMGLAVVHGIVSRHGGEISVSSSPGEGSCFHVYFPLVENAAATADDVEAALPAGKKDRRLLLVEDEEDILQAVSRMIEHLGFQVESFASSRQALESFRAAPARFDLVITDQVMPELTGMELAQKVMEIRPGMPVVLFTGYCEAISPEDARKKGIRRYALKPLNLKAIAEIIDEALTDPAS